MLGRLFVPLRGQQPLQRHEVPRVAAHGKRQQPPAGRAAAVLPAPAAGQVAGEEEEGTGDAEEGAEAAGQAQQGVQRPGAPPATPVLLAPGAAPAVKGQEREDNGGQGAQAEQSPAGGGGGGGREQQQREEALRGVLAQGGRAALHVAVPQALRAAAAGERQGGSRPAAVRLLAVLRGFAGSVVGGGRGGGFSLFPHGGRGRGREEDGGKGAGRASSGPAAPPSSPQEKGAGLSRRFPSAGSGVRSMVGKDGKERKGKSLARSFASPERIQRQGLAVASQRSLAVAAAGEAPAGVGVRRGTAPDRRPARLPSRRCTRRARKPLRRHVPRERLRANCHALTASR